MNSRSRNNLRDSQQGFGENPGQPVRTRQCIVTRTLLPTSGMIRFVVAPDKAIIPDIVAKLPGRGLWLEASRQTVQAAVKQSLFAKAARQTVLVEPDLDQRVAALLKRRCLERLALIQKSGQIITGFTKLKSALENNEIAVLIHAVEAAPDGIKKLAAKKTASTRHTNRPIPVVRSFTGSDLDAALGGSNLTHIGIKSNRQVLFFMTDLARLINYQGDQTVSPRAPLENSQPF